MAIVTRAIRPQPGPQSAFMATPADIAIYGGSAGGGKSYALLMEASRHASRNPRFGAVLFRRLSPQITQEGGLWDTAGEIFPAIGGVPKIGDLRYDFPRAGKVTFRHLQHEATKYNWQGGQIPLIGFDELTHFTESQFFYLLSRARSTCGVRPYIRGTCNPDAGSWVKRLLAPWVDRKHPMYPTPSGVILWMIRHKGVIEYGRTREEILKHFGPKARPKSITFIRASIHDNPALLDKDPDYLANLEMQTDVERERLLHGNWDVVNEGLVYPEFPSIIVEPGDWPTDLAGKHLGGIDWGFRDPFASVGSIEDVDGNLWIGWTHYKERQTLTALSKALPRHEARPYRWWADPAGASQIAEFRLAGHDVVPCVHKGDHPIRTGIAMVTQRIREKSIRVLGTLGDLIDESAKYRYGDKGDPETPVDLDNHLMDALRYLVVGRDRFDAVKDATPPESEESIRQREEAQRLEREALEEEYRDPDADHWWS
ncbi:terminase large subunit domain-containing protein [Tundrisphaera lichenicola]|uniref:terminase large subunit domain-containing protein n=1 Tax=Tundrisphaera lichenicola TaxID=2029860 RepID=UPI003EB9FD2F